MSASGVHRRFAVGGRYLVHRLRDGEVLEVRVERITEAGNVRYQNLLTGSWGWFTLEQVKSELRIVEVLFDPAAVRDSDGEEGNEGDGDDGSGLAGRTDPSRLVTE